MVLSIPCYTYKKNGGRLQNILNDDIPPTSRLVDEITRDRSASIENGLSVKGAVSVLHKEEDDRVKKTKGGYIGCKKSAQNART